MSKPTILLITADELRKDILGCYGGDVIGTPNLDALAESGIRFNRAYCASPWCLPSRCSILTGLYPSRSGAYSNFRKKELNGGLPNLFNALRENGYKTALSGKCHFAPVPYGQTRPEVTQNNDELRSYYLTLGIDDLFLQDGKEVSAWFMDEYAEELERDGLLETYRAARWDRDTQKVYPFPLKAERYPDIWVGNKMTEYIRSYDNDRPAMMWLSFSGPHYPFDAPAEYYERVDMDALAAKGCVGMPGEFDGEDRIHHKSYHGGGNIDGCGAAPDRGCKNFSDEYWTRLRRSYYANMALIDDMVGQVVTAAKEKWGDDLMIIFTADHGEMLGNHGLWGKHNCAYEDVWNVPLLLRYPGHPGGVSTDAKVQLTDLFATCMNAAGIEAQATDGTDLLTLMETGGHEYVFAEGEGYLAVSDGVHKYVHIRKPREEYYEFIDLASDPQEFRNGIDDPENAKALCRLQKAAVTHFMDRLLP